MKLNPHDFRRLLEEKSDQRRQADKLFLNIQNDLLASNERRNKYFEKLALAALDAALEGEEALCLDEVEPVEYEDFIRRLGFEIEWREVQVDSILKLIDRLNDKAVILLENRLIAECSKMLRIFPMEESEALWEKYTDLSKSDENSRLRLKNLILLIGCYSSEYKSNAAFTSEIDAKLWLHLSRVKDVIDLYDPENASEQAIQPVLRWSNSKIVVQQTAADDSVYSIFNPEKLRFINSQEGAHFFALLRNEFLSQIELVSSFVECDIHQDSNSYRVHLGRCVVAIPYSSADLKLILQRMGFKVILKNRKSGNGLISSLRIHF